ncbi:MAG: patatin-like phospholipase family protein [Candidatus Dormiibacterota bacterium]
MGKTALVLSGGGLAGAVYHIGAMRALNDALLDRSVNDFDLYVGTSAGAVIASCLANGIGTKDLLRSVSGQAGYVNLHRADVFMPNYKEFAAKLVGLPLITASAILHALRHVGDMDFFDFGALFADALPSGFFDSSATARYLHRVFEYIGATDNFRELRKDLVCVATDLDNGDRAVFGTGHNDRVPISMAAAASAAVPVLYTPISINGRDYVDGGLRGTASIDVAIEAGCDLIICVNPLVPFDNTSQDIPKLGPNARSVREKGFSAIINQITRISLHAGLQYHLKQLRRAHPEVDIIQIQPKRTDARMFFNNPMRFSSRMLIARHGYESVIVELDESHDKNKEILAKHGLSVRRSLVREQLRLIKRAAYDPRVISKVLQLRTRGPLMVGHRDERWDQLASTLELLDREVAYRHSETNGNGDKPVAAAAKGGVSPVGAPRNRVAQKRPRTHRRSAPARTARPSRPPQAKAS